MHSVQTNKGYHSHPTQSDPDSQTDPHQAHNTWRSCSAASFHGRNTGFAGERAGMRYLLAWFPLSDAPRRCIRLTTTGCRRKRIQFPLRGYL